MLVAGIPASGKSTFVEKSVNEGFVVVCPDEIRKIVTGQDFYRPAEEFVWATVKTSVRFLLARHSVMVDATNLTIGSRKQWVEIAKEIGVPIGCYWFDTPIEVCLERNEKRERKVPVAVMENMESTKVFPTYEEGFDGIWIIRNDQFIRVEKPTQLTNEVSTESPK